MAPNLKFDVKVVRTASPNGLRWPKPSEASDERNLGCNREYVDLRGCSWEDLDRVADLENQLIARLMKAHDVEDEYDLIADELYETDDEGLFGLDIGVASAVVALAAFGCIPFSNCNGGAYGGRHHEEHPLVAFFARPAHFPILTDAAEEADAGLERDSSGALLLYTDDIQNMNKFAEALERRSQARTAHPEGKRIR
jgi:hypothetical protein